MKRSTLTLTALAVLVYLGGKSGFSQGPSQGGGAVHGGPTTHGKSSTSHGSKAGSSHAGETSGKTPSEMLAKNTKLASKLEGLLGYSGPNALSELQSDASGFKSLGRFVAAVHVSKNLGIDFNKLKSTMLGTDPGKKPTSLGQAIHKLDANADAKGEARKATKEAQDDIKEASS